MSDEPVTEPTSVADVPPLPPPPLPPAAPDRSIIETRPELLLGAAAAGGFILARILGRLRGG